MDLHLLTDKELAILQLAIDKLRRTNKTIPPRPQMERSFAEAEDHQAPETYIAKPQTTDGIPRLDPAADFYGTGSGSGVGTGSDLGYDEPGKADCDVYQMVINSSTGDPELHVVGLNLTVYNLSLADLEQDWILVTRTKFGKWIAIPYRPEVVKIELLQNLAQFPDPIVPVLAAYRKWVPTLNNNHGGWETDCDDTLWVADYNEVGYEANVGGFGRAELHLRAREPRVVGTLVDLCCLGDEKGVCV